jgi:hypothetical protein
LPVALAMLGPLRRKALWAARKGTVVASGRSAPGPSPGAAGATIPFILST